MRVASFGFDASESTLKTSTDVDVFKVDSDASNPNEATRMIGYFAVVSSAAGQSYVVNIDNDDTAPFGSDFVDPSEGGLLRTPLPRILPHQLRDAIPDRGSLAEENV